jgi:uncharacterized protein with PIN domain
MEPAFAAERTLGKLGKWLRLLGFDTIIETECPREAFFEHGSGRILLTRTRRVMIAQAALKPVLIRSNDPFEQLGEVVRAAALTPEGLRPFTRCLRCNESIVPVPRRRFNAAYRITCGNATPISAPARAAAGCIGREPTRRGASQESQNTLVQKINF